MRGDPPDGESLPSRDELLAGSRRRRSRQLLFLVESWSDVAEDRVFEFLQSTEVFAGFSRTELHHLLPFLEPVHVAAGEIVIREGDEGDCLYIVGYGRLRVFHRRDDEEWALTDIAAGETAGEAALLTNLPRAASVRAVRDSLLLRLSRSGLERFSEQHPQVPLRLAGRLLTRVISPEAGADPSSQQVRTVAVLAAGDSVVPEAFVDDLATALRRYGSVHRLTSVAVDEGLGGTGSQTGIDDARNGRIVEWLQRIERNYQLVLYVADPVDTNWTRRCLRQADRVLVVASAGADPRLGPGEQALLRGNSGSDGPRVELVMLHPPQTLVPTGTRQWLAVRSVAAHHHVRAGDASDHRRLARFVTGRAVGVVFGGGGARGSAHLGVLRALEERGLPIDAVGGTSIGSVAAFMFVMGWDHEERMARLPLFFSRRLIVQPTIPLVSISSGKRLLRMMMEVTENRWIEDLWIPYFSVSTNLSRATEVVHDRGKLSLAMRASVSLPGILPPVRLGTDLLVDGGLLNNLPIDVMRRVLGGGRVIAIDLRRRVELTMRAEVGPALSGWEVLLRKLWRRGQRFDPPSLGAVLQRSVELAGLLNERTLLDRNAPELLLRPPVGTFGTLEFEAAPMLVDAAYAYSLAQLDQMPVDELFDARPGQ